MDSVNAHSRALLSGERNGFRGRGCASAWLRALIASAALGWCAGAANAASFAYVTNAFGATVSVVDTETNQIATTVAFPPGSVPFATAITPDLKKVYVTSMDTTSTCGTTSVFAIDTANNSVGANPAAVGCEPTGIAISPDGKRVYVASQFSDTIAVIDTATDAVIATITLTRGTGAGSIALSPDGLHAYVTGQIQNTVMVIDTSSNTLVGAPIAVGTSPQAIAVSPNGKQVYVANNASSGSVTVIDSASNTVANTIVVGSYPSSIAFTPDGSRAYVTNGGINNGVFTVSVIDTASGAAVGSPITVDSFPNSIAITVDGKQAYVGNEGSNTVSVIDTATNTVTSTLTGLNSPRGVAARPVPPGIAVPNVVGATQSAATAAISGAGLSVGTVSQQASLAVAPGSVISENPAAGTLLGGGAKIDIEISSGVSVPDVLEMPQALAVNAITAAGLVVGHITQQSSGTVEAGGVISQSPALGTAVAGGSAVDLVISTGPTRNGGGGGIDSLTLTGLLALLAVAWARQGARAQCRGPGDDELDFPSKK